MAYDPTEPGWGTLPKGMDPSADPDPMPTAEPSPDRRAAEIERLRGIIERTGNTLVGVGMTNRERWEMGHDGWINAALDILAEAETTTL